MMNDTYHTVKYRGWIITDDGGTPAIGGDGKLQIFGSPGEARGKAAHQGREYRECRIAIANAPPDGNQGTVHSNLDKAMKERNAKLAPARPAKPKPRRRPLDPALEREREARRALKFRRQRDREL
jgi:hypothetical protein